jgi:cytochrome c oxidase cbb3-type subunit I/II
MVNPRAITEESNMPPYAELATQKVDLSRTAAKMSAMKSIGVPYAEVDIERAEADARADGTTIAKDLAAEGVKVEGADVAADAEVVALIAYLQHLGKKPGAQKPGSAVAEVPVRNGGAP